MTQYLFFGGFMLFVVLMLALDLGVFHKKDHVIGMKEAAVWTVVWIAMSLVLSVVILFRAEWIHGIESQQQLLDYGRAFLPGLLSEANSFEANLKIYRQEMFEQYLAGYFLEKSLSIDNIFVMMMIFISFGIPKEYYHRILFWGILGAIVLRFIFIFALGAIISEFAWVLAVFGVILLFSGAKMFKNSDDERIDHERHPIVRFCSKYFRATPHLDGHNFFTRIEGKRYITPLFIVLLVIEFSDIIFAVDSIPAVFSVTTDSFIVYFSNIFAIMGLRSLFFLLDGMKDKFYLLSYGLGCLLIFIGLKMILGICLPGFHIGTTVSLCVILGILLFSIVFSLIFPKKQQQ